MRRMSRLTLIAALGVGLLPGAVLADGHGKWKERGGHYEHDYRGCPPGLAKKHNGCRPPGLVREHHEDRYDEDEHHRWRRGERITRNYIVLREPARYGLDPRDTYWRADGYVYRVDRKTGEVLALIGLAQSLLGN